MCMIIYYSFNTHNMLMTAVIVKFSSALIFVQGTAIGRAIGNIFENRNSHSKAETSVTADNITDSNSENKESTYNEYEITNRSEDVESNGQNSYYDDDDDDDDNDDDK